ncbi:AraC family transcriptional regulator [Hahella ganghwensis]|uniref:AraC family transcriptional regulator n=1 Tax=Hahella ganghwensis TaxID=286420 RepID=UPI00037FE6BC|nr:AraC family transcriptional regulator [Hahella ganghwensis]
MTNALTYDVPLISTRYARRFLRFMGTKGVSADVLLSNSEVDAATLNNPDAFLSVNQVIRTLEHAEWLVADERAAFQFGQQLDLIAHGLFGYVLLSQDDYCKLVEMVVEHLRVCLPLVDMEVSISGSDVRIRLHDTWQMGKARPFLAKIYMGSIYTVASQISRNMQFEFDFSSELNDAAWHAVAPDAKWRFGAEHNQVTLPIIGRHHQDDHQRVAYSLAKERYRENATVSEEANEIATQVREQILKSPGRATLERTAQQLNMSARHLRNHLSQAGTSFREMHNEIRRSYADLYLAETPVPLEDIARKLGFSDQASFTRAYRSWTGKTPGDYRRQAKSATSCN